MQLHWKYQQVTPEGRWTSTEVFSGEYRQAVQGVIAGHLVGQPRAAAEEETGRVVYALDAQGQATAAAVKLFGTIQLADKATSAPASAPWAPRQQEGAMTKRRSGPRA